MYARPPCSPSNRASSPDLGTTSLAEFDVDEPAGELPPVEEAATRRCRRCRETKPLDDFPLDKRAAGGRRSTCRTCKTRNDRERRTARARRSSADDDDPAPAATRGPGHARAAIDDEPVDDLKPDDVLLEPADELEEPAELEQDELEDPDDELMAWWVRKGIAVRDNGSVRIADEWAATVGAAFAT